VTYWFLGGRYSQEQADADFAPVRVAAKNDLTAAGYPTLWSSYKPAGQALDRMSVYEWIESRVPGGHGSAFGRLLDAAYNEEYGADTTDQASLNLVYLLAYQPSPRASRSTASPTSGTTSPAATSSCRRRSPRQCPTCAPAGA
jgi:monoamine oxidase